MRVIDFIKEKSVQALTDELGIRVQDYPDRVVLNYSMIDSPKNDPVVKECRGLILRKPACAEDDWKVLARSFDRFFNLGECHPTKQKEERALLHHPDVVVLEKLDGSLMSVYHEAGSRWTVSSRGMAFAEGSTPQGNTFKDVFERAMGKVEERFKDVDTSFTYVFEVVSPETRVVKPYPKDDIYLLTIRKRTGDYKEMSWDDVKTFAEKMGFKTPKEYKFNTLDEIIRSMRELPELDEGYVCRLDLPDRVMRVKIKNPKYLAIAHLRHNGAISFRRVALLVMLQDYDEYLEYFPEDRKVFDPYIIAYDQMILMIEDLKKHFEIEDQKEFALKVKDTPVGPIMFQLRKGKKLEDIINALTDNSKQKVLESFIKYDL